MTPGDVVLVQGRRWSTTAVVVSYVDDDGDFFNPQESIWLDVRTRVTVATQATTRQGRLLSGEVWHRRMRVRLDRPCSATEPNPEPWRRSRGRAGPITITIQEPAP